MPRERHIRPSTPCHWRALDELARERHQAHRWRIDTPMVARDPHIVVLKKLRHDLAHRPRVSVQGRRELRH